MINKLLNILLGLTILVVIFLVINYLYPMQIFSWGLTLAIWFWYFVGVVKNYFLKIIIFVVIWITIFFVVFCYLTNLVKGVEKLWINYGKR